MQEIVILKSINPEKYPDLKIKCKVIENNEISHYIKKVPDFQKIYAKKKSPVEVRRGVQGEIIKTILKVNIKGRQYILMEEEKIVQDGDMVITNVYSSSKEKYVNSKDQFIKNYDGLNRNPDGTCNAIPEILQLVEVDENLIIITNEGNRAICLKGSYIVVNNETLNDYNTLEREAKRLTYEEVEN